MTPSTPCCRSVATMTSAVWVSPFSSSLRAFSSWTSSRSRRRQARRPSPTSGRRRRAPPSSPSLLAPAPGAPARPRSPGVAPAPAAAGSAAGAGSSAVSALDRLGGPALRRFRRGGSSAFGRLGGRGSLRRPAPAAPVHPGRILEAPAGARAPAPWRRRRPAPPRATPRRSASISALSASSSAASRARSASSARSSAMAVAVLVDGRGQPAASRRRTGRAPAAAAPFSHRPDLERRWRR